MGTRGPVPKRTDQRRRVNKPEIPVSNAPAGAVEQPPAEDYWHPIARDFYNALAKSGQSAFYQASDWATARYVAEAMDRNLQQEGRFSATLFAAVMAGAASLLATEADRRRLRIELERAKAGEPKDPDGVVTELAEYKRRAAGAG